MVFNPQAFDSEIEKPPQKALPPALLLFAPLNKGFVCQTPEPPKPKRPGSTKFTTEYAIDWGRRQGWKLIDRERYNHLTKRHHDLMLGMDALMDSPEGMVCIQGAGKSERSEHYKRFEQRGGVEKAARRKVRCVYVEFERGNKEPIKTEWWA